jgi:hypothetical protein
MNTIWRILVLLVAAILIWAVVRPLAQTKWAQSVRERARERLSIRVSSGVNSSGEPTQSTNEIVLSRRHPRNVPDGLRYVLPFVKELVMMGVPALAAYGILAFLRLQKRTGTRGRNSPENLA